MKTQRHRITFESTLESTVVSLGMLGRSTEQICLVTGLTPCQVAYRLTKAKNAMGLPSGVGFRSSWRDGSSSVAKQVQSLVFSKLQKKVQRELPPKFVVVSAWDKAV
jgi:hypothetical protein